MLNESRSLARRIRRSYYLLALLLCAIFISIFIYIEEYLEGTILYAQLSEKLHYRIEMGDDFSSGIFFGDEYKFYNDDRIPDYLKNVSWDGSLNEVEIGGLELAVVGVVVNGRKYVVTSEQHQIEYLENVVLIFLLSATFVGIFIAFIFSRFIVQTTISPLRTLANVVKSGQVDQSGFVKLDDEIGFLARSISEKDRQLRQFLEREKNFTGDVSHELRTPLAIIWGASEVLDAELLDNPAARKHVARILRTTEEAANLAAVLLVLARTPDTIDAPRTNISTVVNELLEGYGFMITKKSVTCSSEVAPDVFEFIRPELVRVACGNLIRNAFQYTDSGAVSVVLRPDAFIVEDTGCGIPESIQVALFERYNRGAESAGLGIGLSIVDRICEHVGWQVEYENIAPRGSRFTVSFSRKGSS
jgi:signal transduction histidine kinase